MVFHAFSILAGNSRSFLPAILRFPLQGWYTINICKQFSNITSYAFEPVKETWNRLDENIKLNQLNNCLLYNVGLSNVSREEKVFYNPEESGAASMVDIRESDGTKVVNCSFVRLDDFAEKSNVSCIDFIKCDVEGAELLVYQGGVETIKKYRPVIFSEMLRKWSAKFNYHPNQIIELFASLGYQCYVIRDNKLKTFSMVNEETKETNYFFLHGEKHDGLIKTLTV